MKRVLEYRMLSKILLTFKMKLVSLNHFSRRHFMDPDKIELNNLAKSFEYIKIASEIDECDDRDVLRNIAKSFCKLYYKQQETLSVIGIPANG